jgi:predicted dehydrogenase
MKVAIIGAGLIGCERANVISKIPEATLTCIYDPNINQLNKIKNIPTTTNIDKIYDTNPDWVFICTPHDVVLDLTKQAFDNNTNVLIEKPLGRNVYESNLIIENKPEHLKLNVGFNYRFYAGVAALLKDIKANKFGKLISVNMILGHGNSPGMENSWKLNFNKCGGGCLIDPGVHLLDLILNICTGKLDIKSINCWNGFWNTGIEEECHLIITDQNNTIFNTQISINKWRSTFRLEVNGTEGYGIVEGRDRSYGSQSYKIGKRWGWQSGKNQIDSEEIIINNYDGNDSFLHETMSVLGLKNENACTHNQALDVMILLDKLYSNK